jgi:hypothetical protein
MPIPIGAAVMLATSMAIRQCFGLFMQPLTKDLAITIADFTLALSIQNLAWGFLSRLPTGSGWRHGDLPCWAGTAGVRARDTEHSSRRWAID